MLKAKLISADFESNIVEIRVENGFIAKAGEYVVLSKEEFEELSEKANVKSKVKKNWGFI